MSQNAEKLAASGLHYFDFHKDSEYEVIRHQYRRLVQQCHPDRHDFAGRATAHTQFIEINAAFKLLRQHYQQFGYLPTPDIFQMSNSDQETPASDQMAKNNPSHRTAGRKGKVSHHKKRHSSQKQKFQSAESKSMKTALLLLLGAGLLIGVVLITVLVPMRG
ncbi:MAG: DnaJ domain-containing protein [Granulosicoccus sp.]